MTVTKGSLDKLTKDRLVIEVLALNATLETLSTQPLTGSQVVKQQLSLAEKATQAEVTIAELQKEKELALETLEKEFEIKQTATLEDVTAAYAKLQVKIKDSKVASVSSLTKVEAETAEKIEIVIAGLGKAKEEATEKVAALEAQVTSVRESSEHERASINKENDREIEDLEYDHKVAVKQLNTTYAHNLAKGLGQSLVNTAELKDLQNLEAVNADTIKDAVAAEKGKLTGILKAQHDSATKDLTHGYEMQLNTLGTEKTALENALSTAALRIATLETQVNNIPAVIKDSLTAAKADISVTNESAKK